MNSFNAPTFAILSQHKLADGSLIQRIIYSTHSQPHFERICSLVQLQQANTPRPYAKRINARPIVFKSWANQRTAYEAKASGLLKDLPKLGTVWPSITDAAKALGFPPANLSQALYRARKEQGGTDTPAVVHGLCFAYSDGSPVSI